MKLLTNQLCVPRKFLSRNFAILQNRNFHFHVHIILALDGTKNVISTVYPYKHCTVLSGHVDYVEPLTYSTQLKRMEQQPCAGALRRSTSSFSKYVLCDLAYNSAVAELITLYKHFYDTACNQKNIYSYGLSVR